MYKKVKKYAITNGMSVDEKAGIAYGRINGYFLAIYQDPVTPARHTLQLWVKPGNAEAYPTILDFVNQCTPKFKYLTAASYTGTKITAEFWGTGFKWGSEYVPCIDAFLKELTNYCNANQLVTCCEACGSVEALSLYQIDSTQHLFCSSCYAGASEKLHKEVSQKANQGGGNVIGGLIGALLGALLGAVLWVLIYQLGYISALGGAVMVVCAMKGYELLGGRLNVLGIVISCLISAVMLLLAEQTCLAIEIYKIYRDYNVSFFDVFTSVPNFLEDPDVMSAVVRDMIMGYILMAVGAGGTIHQTYKSNKNSVNTRQITSI